MSVLSIYVVFASGEEAERIGRAMIEERLAACINILGPIRSIYRWQGKLEESDEVAAILKTSSAAADRLTLRIAELHSYELPCIVAWPVEKLLAAYADWVEENCDKG